MFQELIARIAASLGVRKIPYMIIGGQAVLLYGEPRLTRDIDVTLGADVSRLGDLLRSVDDIGLTPLPEDVESFVKRTLVLPARHEPTGIRVDFIFSLTPYEIGAIARARKVPVAGQEVAFASVEDLIIHKIFAGRPRDLEDVRSVLLRNPDVEFPYIRRWLTEFDRSAEGGHFTETLDDILAGLR
ncbi:MAG: nucleotidyl transferase AbiEii/AbiGii toxin family protein [bacterium]|nr:MAG: nucleotidyl transferase AbiEii/AbiGii toxin family protein [bacterium]